MNYYEDNGKIVLDCTDSFNIAQTLECGQCFRFEKTNDGYLILARGKVLNVSQIGERVEFWPCTMLEFEQIWLDYFDLRRDYRNIKEVISANDFVMRDAVEFAPGIRILRQDVWESLISFIISQNNRIPMIKKVIGNICEAYGDKISDGCYSFPTSKQLAQAKEEDLMRCKTGFRAKYILDATNKVLSGEIAPDDFENLPTDEVRRRLMSIAGVGPKVSDCVLLFACARFEVFPTDVWVKRIMSHFYFDGVETKIDDIHALAKKRFGQYAGFAQQYLFHYVRCNSAKILLNE